METLKARTVASEEERATSAPVARYPELDSLRGLAALIVVLHHFVLAQGEQFSSAINHTPLVLLTRGHESVLVFFLLSGFVLALPYVRHRPSSYPRYLIKRICRIYLPYLAALALAVGLNFRFHNMPFQNAWVQSTWSSTPQPATILGHIAFLGNYDWLAFNSAFWSLIYEMRISFFFPLIGWLVMRLSPVKAISIAIAGSMFAKLIGVAPVALLHLHLDPMTLYRTSISFHYASFFIIGALMARWRSNILNWIGKSKRRSRALLWGVALLLWGTCAMAGGVTLREFIYRDMLSDWGAAIAGIIFITMALADGSFRKFLGHKIIHHLGRISYSLYLIHGTILLTWMYLIQKPLPLWTFPIYLLMTVLISELFYRLIEKPSMSLGHAFAKK